MKSNYLFLNKNKNYRKSFPVFKSVQKKFSFLKLQTHAINLLNLAPLRSYFKFMCLMKQPSKPIITIQPNPKVVRIVRPQQIAWQNPFLQTFPQLPFRRGTDLPGAASHHGKLCNGKTWGSSNGSLK